MCVSLSFFHALLVDRLWLDFKPQHAISFFLVAGLTKFNHHFHVIVNVVNLIRFRLISQWYLTEVIQFIITTIDSQSCRHSIQGWRPRIVLIY